MKYLLLMLALLIYTKGVHANEDSPWTKFIFTFPYQRHGGTPRVYVTTQEKQPVTVTVSVPGIGFQHSTNITYDESGTVDLPEEAAIRVRSSAKVTNKSVIVDATAAVAVYGLYDSGVGSYDAFFILPTTALGKDYVTIGYDPGTTYYSEFIVLAIENETTIDVTGQIELSLSLQQYEAYQFVADDDVMNVTGMVIKADKPISVMSGHQCAIVPAFLACDYLMENIPPVNLLGHQYVLAPFLGRTSGFIYRIISASPGITDVSISGEIISLLAGEFYEGDSLTSDEVISIMSNKPVLVSQYAKGYDWDPVGDPFVVVIPSTQTFSHVNVTFPIGGITLSNPQYYISIISACQNVDLFYLDDILISTQNMLQTSDGEFCVLRTSVSPGFHSVTQPSAEFLVLVYGFATQVSYGYVAGYQVHTEYNSALDASTSMSPSITMITSIHEDTTKQGCNSFEIPFEGTIAPNNMNKEFFQFGETVTIYCRRGFELIGDETLACLTNEQSLGEIPKCSAKEDTSGVVVLLVIVVAVVILYCKRANTKPDTALPVYYSTHIPAAAKPDRSTGAGIQTANTEHEEGGNDNTGYQSLYIGPEIEDTSTAADIKTANTEGGNDNTYQSIDPVHAADRSSDNYQGLYAVPS